MLSFRQIAKRCTAVFLFLFCVNCTANKAKWSWIQNALEKKEISLTAVDDSVLKEPPYAFHPFLNADFQLRLDKLSDSSLSYGNELKLLADSNSTNTKLQLIASAKSSIFMSTYMVICDQDGKIFMDALASASARGVDVRILVDGGYFNTLYAGSCPESYRSKGLQVSRSNYSFFPSSDDMKLHDKLLIIDGEVAVTGGQNIGSFWAKSSGQNGYFRDTDILVKGPVVDDMSRRFVKLWKTVHPSNSNLEAFEAQVSERSNRFLALGSQGIHNYAKWFEDKEPKGLCRFVAQDPQLGTFYVFKAYTALTKETQQRIVFHVPSLNGKGSLVQEELLNALRDAASNQKIQVDVITNGPGLLRSHIINKPFGWVFGVITLGLVYESVKDSMLNIYAYKSWIHSKVFNFDGVAVAVGSFNFDETGVDWMENTLICMDKDLSMATRDLLVRDLSNSRLLPKATSATLNQARTTVAQTSLNGRQPTHN